MDTPCCPDSPLCQVPTEPVAREAWHLDQERLERTWLDQHIREQLALLPGGRVYTAVYT